MNQPSDILIIGVGAAEHGDDAAGPEVIRRLRGRLPAGVRSLALRGEVTELLDAWREASLVIIADACVSGAEPGTIRRFNAARERVPALRAAGSSHELGLAAAIELARVLGELPDRVVLYAIEGAAFEPETPLSAEVARAAAQVADRVLEELLRR